MSPTIGLQLLAFSSFSSMCSHETLEVCDPSKSCDQIGPNPTLNPGTPVQEHPIYPSILRELEKSTRYGGGAVKKLTKATMLQIAHIVGITVVRKEKREKRFLEEKLQMEAAKIRSKLQDDEIRQRVVECIRWQARSQKEAYEKRQPKISFAGHGGTKTKLSQYGGIGVCVPVKIRY
jgi:hypothetical protein